MTTTPSDERRVAARPRRLRVVLGGASWAALLFVAAAAVVEIDRPRVRVRWSAAFAESGRAAAERDHGLVDALRLAEPDGVWSYRVADGSRDAMARLAGDARVASLTNVDPGSALPPPSWSLRWRPPNEWGDAWRRQSTFALGAAALLLGVSLMGDARWRRAGALACVVGFAMAALSHPIAGVRMGDVNTYTSSRASFEQYFASDNVRFEAHLASMLLRALYRIDPSPESAFRMLAALATAWFAIMMILAGWLGRWSPSTVRYLALAVASPAALMYFGYRELGYLALNPAAFPLVLQGIRGCRARYEAGSAAFGLGAALHAFGLLSLAGTALMTLVAPVTMRTRGKLLTRAFVFGSTAYLIWIFVWVAGLHLQILPGHAEDVPWRPLFEHQLAVGRINSALFSLESAREIVVGTWMAGWPLLALAVGALLTRRRQAVMALAFSLPALAFSIMFWPIQGLAVESDLVFAAFPAMFALAWLAAQSTSTTVWACALLVTSHVVFWRTLLGDVFVSSRIY